MRASIRTTGLVALVFAAGIATAQADGVRDSVWIDPGFPATPPGGRDLAIDVMPDAPSYPGPSVDTWLGRRYPPPAPPEGYDFAAAPAGEPGLNVAEMLAVIGGSPRQDEFEACMDQAGAIDFVEALGACFCLTVGDASPGCAADGF